MYKNVSVRVTQDGNEFEVSERVYNHFAPEAAAAAWAKAWSARPNADWVEGFRGRTIKVNHRVTDRVRGVESRKHVGRSAPANDTASVRELQEA